jgi:acetylornithine/succinyldiaminopimelate/putrescine aminotransferase
LLLFQVVRFIPALIVSEAQVDKAMSIFKKAVEEVAHEG